MINTRGAVRRLNISHSKTVEFINAIKLVRTITYDPALRSLLTELEYERAMIEERIQIHEGSNNLYQATVARMDLSRNRSTHRELIDLATVERLGWTDDTRRTKVNIACSSEAAHGYALGVDRGSNGPRPGTTNTTLFSEVIWNKKKVPAQNRSALSVALSLLGTRKRSR